MNAEGERSWSLRESEMRHTFTTRYQELEQDYAKKLRNYDVDMRDAESEKIDLRADLNHMGLSLRHLLWHGMSQQQKIEELRLQKYYCQDALARFVIFLPDSQ